MSRTLLCYGDSNTHGTMPMESLGALGRFAHRHRWPRLLAELLPGWEVIAEGHPGRTTVHDDPVEGEHRNGRKALAAILESHRPVNLVLLMLGTNDLKHRFGVTASDIASGLERLVRMIRASGCGPMGGAPEVLVVAPPPIRETGVLAPVFAGGAAKSQQLGAEIGAMAARTGAAFLDLQGVIEVSPVDGIHYEAAAAEVLAQFFADKIRALD
ncbi:SGNH/GDSL hydrolase family protein [Pseudogemmobacter faecipullorum]|uniref:SGNH/GDSL hydrolase family protein n=1 Tax=Pseudogemmobacter faecipullorum TaxID=2755041 RepID=A0ABS8CGJ0_9RHOB|nr:SGNH/GDSL hydrolase family protein [Pseudogemmobacter faecipullorum]MCB5408491.1 SGNH/GDSL hydrolase family protein [Pseudogemmobacter faecipullorum]